MFWLKNGAATREKPFVKFIKTMELGPLYHAIRMQ